MRNRLNNHAVRPGARHTSFGALGGRLLRELGWELGDGVPAAVLARAVRDAESLASVTPYPQLVLPELAREKIMVASNWHRRQLRIYEQTSVAFAE